MLIEAKHMYGSALDGPDGRVGTLYDILFDDQSWHVRHLVVSMDRWFLGQQVLLDPRVIEKAAWPDRRVEVQLTKEQVRHSPSVDTDLPAARQSSVETSQVLVWEAYWSGVLDASREPTGDPHLRSTRMLTGLHLHCTNGQLGHIADFLLDDEGWSIRDLVVDTRNWWPGKHVLVEPGLIDTIDWDQREVRLSIAREEVEERPAFEHGVLIDEHTMVSVQGQ